MMEKVTINTLKEMKKAGEKIASLTAYDANFARILDEARVDIILVGDSLGMVLQGEATTLKVSMNDMIYHTRLVKRGCQRAMIVADMPFMSYATPAQALGNAARLVSEGGAEVIKLEGGSVVADTVRHLNEYGIPVCAHLGLTPQSIHKFGGYHVQGREQKTATQIMNDAELLEEAGAVMLVLECIPQQLAADITKKMTIPVIGIGAGSKCDGQVLVLYDILGITERQPRFSKNFLESATSVKAAIENYITAVKSVHFPTADHQFD
ncbi:MAG: 3-methyl-2-oxobutanoate hydroxymethyltransferase [Gammaproteobacteria bacterium]|nr:3-methyl-2-oxobutanoate hydroxymethyltransferase [Gammaproteobacteria bacterium]